MIEVAILVDRKNNPSCHSCGQGMEYAVSVSVGSVHQTRTVKLCRKCADELVVAIVNETAKAPQ